MTGLWHSLQWLTESAARIFLHFFACHCKPDVVEKQGRYKHWAFNRFDRHMKQYMIVAAQPEKAISWYVSRRKIYIVSVSAIKEIPITPHRLSASGEACASLSIVAFIHKYLSALVEEHHVWLALWWTEKSEIKMLFWHTKNCHN